MKIVVLTGQFDPNWNIGQRTIGSKVDYCTRHGYDLVELKRWSGVKDFCWQKVWQAEYLLNTYDAVVWFDADSIITNPSITIESLIDDRHALFASEDHCHDPRTPWWINAGNLIWRRHPDIRTLFHVARQLQPQVNHEQEALQAMIFHKLPGSQFIKTLPGKMIGAVPDETVAGFQLSLNTWTPDCLLAHLTGVAEGTLEKRRLDWLDKHFPQ